jgi:hypothetical protein
MNEWAEEKQYLYLSRLLRNEGRQSNVCSQCQTSHDTVWRCVDCVGAGELCRGCLKVSHARNPFHRVAKWNGHFFQPSWLWRVGVIVCLGHNGSLCPSYQSTYAEMQDRCIKSNGILNDDGFDPDDPTFGATPSDTQIGSGKVITFVHTNGFHHLPVYPCQCDQGPPLEEQLLEMELYPATSTDPSTVFTLSLLNHFHLMRVDSHLSTENYCRILQRQTNFVFPDKTPVRPSALILLLTSSHLFIPGSETRVGSSLATMEPSHQSQTIWIWLWKEPRTS